ncbi:MAG: ACR3 family arsenite efflux transporter [Flavobacteriia bacterium]|nr:ACR3 family arsenite efflux transporter [Flavobacteriia bacterium]
MKKKLKWIDRFLSYWILIAMVLGVGIGYYFPSSKKIIDAFSDGTTNYLLAIGLILMMFPPLLKVDFSAIPILFKKGKQIVIALFITWIIGPFLMFFLANWILSAYPEYLTGLIIIGIAPCIAMVIVWNELAEGNRELCAAMVGINSVLQVFFFSSYAYFFLGFMLPHFGKTAVLINISFVDVAKTVFIYLGIPFILAVITRQIAIQTKGKQWHNQVLIPRLSPITLIALLFTILLMFSLKGDVIVQLPFDVLRISSVLILFFIIQFFLMFFVAKMSKANYPDSASYSFTASGNNFELAIAVSIGLFGIHSGEALAGVVGPLVEVPVLLLLVNVSKWIRTKFY